MKTPSLRAQDCQAALPAAVGIGLRPPHYRELLDRTAEIGWLEVHSENYFGAGGQPHYFLERFRAELPISLHGVGMSLGSATGLDARYLTQLKALVDRVDPAVVSDHICWGRIGPRHLNELLPIPYTEEALDIVCDNVSHAQEVLQRHILIENVSSYVQFCDSQIAEADFVTEVAHRTGCQVLLDVNNIYVSAQNHGFDPVAYLQRIAFDRVAEIHLAGFDRTGPCLIDAHGTRVAGAVWNLYGETLRRLGRAVPTLIEWDTDIPELDVLLQEASQARQIMQPYTNEGVHHALAA